MKKVLVALLAIASSLSIMIYITACGSEDSSNSDGGSSPTSTVYGGPGSEWKVSLASDNSFEITRAEEVGGSVVMTVTGTYQTLDSGYLKLTVTSSTGTDAPPAGATAYALNIPNFVLLLKPTDADSEIIPMITSGTCPSSGFDLNWIVTSHQQSGDTMTDLSTGKDLIGTASYDGTNTLSLTAKKDLSGSNVTPLDSMTGTCSDGIITLNDGEANIWLSASGAALVQTVDDNSTPDDYSDDSHGVIVAMPQDGAVTVSELDGDYIGLMFSDATSSGDKVQPIWVTFDSAGTTEGGTWTDVDAGTKGSAAVTLTSFGNNTSLDGFFSALVDNGSANGPMTCQVKKDVVEGSNLIFCVATEPGDTNSLYNLLLISQ